MKRSNLPGLIAELTVKLFIMLSITFFSALTTAANRGGDFSCEVKAVQAVSKEGIVEPENFSGTAELLYLNKIFSVDRKTGIIVRDPAFENNSIVEPEVFDDPFNSFVVISGTGQLHHILQIGFWSANSWWDGPENELPFLMIQTNVILSGICTN